jgi:hypothetical protein
VAISIHFLFFPSPSPFVAIVLTCHSQSFNQSYEDRKDERASLHQISDEGTSSQGVGRGSRIQAARPTTSHRKSDIILQAREMLYSHSILPSSFTAIWQREMKAQGSFGV